MKYGIEKENKATLILEKSEFIGLVFPLQNLEEISKLLSYLKQSYPDATHYCYAYRFEGISRSNDDGEPSGTAGRPLLELLNKKELDRLLLVVVRYFGGKKLGAGRLLRTYVETGNRVLSVCRVGIYQTFSGYRIALKYSFLDLVKQWARDCNAIIEQIVYNETVEMTVYGPLDAWPRLDGLLPHIEKREALAPKEVLFFMEEKNHVS
jgi:uncharacterized YigZ family protein